MDVPKKKKKKMEVKIDATDPLFGLTGKPSNDIDNAVVTLDEKEYQRLREIEDGIKQLFQLAFKVEGVVAFGRVKPGFKEPKLIIKLRELTGEKRYEPPVEKEKKTK